ncbi:hypothetical protein P4132_25090 [Pseudomonas aeruginosa]|nr:hypothetical protein [Pseudomonas aeruginosa]
MLDVSSIEVMRPLLKRPSVVIMENCGHVPMVERPEETAQHYQAFLDGVRNAQVAGRENANRRLGAGSGSGNRREDGSDPGLRPGSGWRSARPG